jgi:hypothetical protein
VAVAGFAHYASMVGDRGAKVIDGIVHRAIALTRLPPLDKALIDGILTALVALPLRAFPPPQYFWSIRQLTLGRVVCRRLLKVHIDPDGFV